MEEKNELNDIILNRGGSTNNNKKIVLAVATLGVILIIVVMLMNTITSNGTDNLPQAVLPPKPELHAPQSLDEPLFEEVKVVQEQNLDTNNLDEIAKKLKQESQETKEQTPFAPQVVPQVEEEPKIVKEAVKTPVKEKVVPPKQVDKTPSKTIVSGGYYIQVGSFSKNEPNKKFLNSISEKGFSYTYQNVTKNATPLNKVLVGPFKNEKEAREALKVIRSSIEAGAFITKM